MDAKVWYLRWEQQGGAAWNVAGSAEAWRWRERAWPSPWTRATDAGISTAGVITFFLWVPVFRSAVEMFNCIEVDEGSAYSPFQGRWLILDMSQRCFEGMHLRYAVTAAIISLVVCLAVRFDVWLVLPPRSAPFRSVL